MVERVYGRLPVDYLRRRLAEAMGETAAPVQQHPRPDADPAHQPDSADSAARAAPNAENQKARPTLPSSGPDARAEVGVPGGGIEPPTRGFSVLAQ
jgi:hypothetical protein